MDYDLNFVNQLVGFDDVVFVLDLWLFYEQFVDCFVLVVCGEKIDFISVVIVECMVMFYLKVVLVIVFG